MKRRIYCEINKSLSDNSFAELKTDKSKIREQSGDWNLLWPRSKEERVCVIFRLVQGGRNERFSWDEHCLSASVFGNFWKVIPKKKNGSGHLEPYT